MRAVIPTRGLNERPATLHLSLTQRMALSMDSFQQSQIDRSGQGWRVPCCTFLLLVSFSWLSPPTTAQEHPSYTRTPRVEEPIATRLVPLYYVQDAEKVIAMVRGGASSASRATASEPTEPGELSALREQERQLQAQRADLLAKIAAHQSQPPSTFSTSGLLAATGRAPSLESLEQDLANVDRNLTALSDQEQTLRADSFRNQSQRAASALPFVSEGRESFDAADRVSISVVGETQLHLRGPLKGVNAITKMIHEIDQPAGEVKIGIHVVQFTETEDFEPNSEPVSLDLFLGHARQMSQTSQALFRAALSNVAARCYAQNADRFEEAFFYSPCVRNFRQLNGSQTLLSLPLLDSRDIVTTLYLAGVANQDVRREIIHEFRRLVSAELPKLDLQYQTSIAAATKTRTEASSMLPRLPQLKPWNRTNERSEPPEPDLSFSQTIACLSSFSGQTNSATAIQVATVRFQRASLELRQAAASLNAMRNDRLRVATSASRSAASSPMRTVSTGGPDLASLDALTDRVIEEQAQRVLDLQEVMRGEVAALDGQLKRLATAFEEDIRRQFYRPALNDLRRNADKWDMRMGQVQTTTIRTNDRMLARVSPAQTAVLDRAVRPVLLQEGLQVAQGLASEAQTLAQAGSLQVAGNAVAPGAAGLLTQAGMVPKAGAHLGELVEKTDQLSVSVGDEISLTPIIQPDGASVAFHLLYTHTPRRESNGKKPASGGVERHLIEANVNIANLELQEVSRFRVALDIDEQGRGIPLLKDIPVAGALFRPRRAAASTTQENVILVEAVIYPTAMAMSGKGWLTSDAAEMCDTAKPPAANCAAAVGRDDLTRWVLENLRREAAASLTAPTAPAQRSAPPSATGPIADTGHPVRR